MRSEEGLALTRAGAFAYAIALVLALVWVVTIVVWDSYGLQR